MYEKAIADFRDNHEDEAIQEAVDKAYPLFQLFGWTYWNDPLPVNRSGLEDNFGELARGALEDLAKTGVTGRHSSGRLAVAASPQSDDYIIVSYSLELSEGYGGGD